MNQEEKQNINDIMELIEEIKQNDRKDETFHRDLNRILSTLNVGNRKDLPIDIFDIIVNILGDLQELNDVLEERSNILNLIQEKLKSY